jgi:hypothetical protein
MPRLSDYKNWVKPPSHGGLSIIELRKRAHKMGIDTSSLTKKQICSRIIKKHKRKTIILKHRGGTNGNKQNVALITGPTPEIRIQQGIPLERQTDRPIDHISLKMRFSNNVIFTDSVMASDGNKYLINALVEYEYDNDTNLSNPRLSPRLLLNAYVNNYNFVNFSRDQPIFKIYIRVEHNALGLIEFSSNLQTRSTTTDFEKKLFKGVGRQLLCRFLREIMDAGNIDEKTLIYTLPSGMRANKDQNIHENLITMYKTYSFKESSTPEPFMESSLGEVIKSCNEHPISREGTPFFK